MARIKSGFWGERAIVLPDSIISNLKISSLGSLLHITDIGFYPKAEFHFRSRTSAEAFQYILIYCIEGTGWFQIEGNYYKVAQNQFFILPKAKSHSYGSDRANPWTICWIHFDGVQADFFSMGFDRPVSVSVDKDSRIEERLHLFEEIFSTLKNGYSQPNLEYSIVCLFHFLGSLKFLGAYRESVYVAPKAHDVAEVAIHYMRENIHNRLTLKSVANYAGLSTSHFSSVFHKKTGYSPLNYFNQLKIQQACHYLDFTDMTVYQISLSLGLDDPLYFSRTFSKTMGMSPTDYRRKKKG